MKASIEISMYPLSDHYGTPILQFIDRLQKYPDIEVQRNTMSSQLFGDYDALMAILTQEMKQAFQDGSDTVMILKIINVNLKP